MPTERRVTLPECIEYINEAPVRRRIDEVIIHHTWRPRAADYRGIETVAAIRHYHMRVRGWSDNGYHIMIAPTGDIFLCRPLERAGGHTLGHNEHSVGLSYIANFDDEHPGLYEGLEMGQRVVAVIVKKFGLGYSRVRFHREFASKSCPGKRLPLETYQYKVSKLMDEENDELRIVLLPGSEVIECDARIENGVTRVDLRSLVEGLGYEVYDHIADQNKVYLRESQ